MRQRMIVTDVARMLSGACIAGYSTDLTQPIRPVLEFGGGLEWDWLSVDHGKVLAPFSVIDVDVERPRPDPPHCEDVVLREPVDISYVGRVPARKVPVALERLAFDSVSEAFGSLVEKSRCIPPGAGIRSLATVRAGKIEYVGIDVKPDDRTLRVRLDFHDHAGDRYRLPVTDIGLLAYCRTRLVDRQQRPGAVSSRIRGILNNAEHVFVRIGASRPFAPSVGSPETCYLLVTGLYSIPEYRRIPWNEMFPTSIPLDGNPLPEEIVSKLASGRANPVVSGA